MKWFVQFVLVAVICSFLAGCVMYNAGFSISAPTSRVPVSLTETFFDANDKIVTKEQYRVVHHFCEEYSRTTFSAICTNKVVDIGGKMNALVRKYGGHAVVNVTVTGVSDKKREALLTTPNLLVGLPTLGIFSFTPFSVVIEGDVVQMNPQNTEIKTASAPIKTNSEHKLDKTNEKTLQ